MPRDILSEYGPEKHSPQAPRATSGGVEKAKPIHNYHPPKGPMGINDPETPGLHGTNHGHDQKCSPTGGSGGPRSGGHTIHRSGSQRG